MKLLHVLLIVMVSVVCVNMGEGGRHFSSSGEPVFAPLEERQGSFLAVIYDEESQTVVRDVSFFGQTSIGGIRRESDDSFNRLEIGDLKQIEVVKPSYDSKRYRNNEFSLIKVTMKNNSVIEDLLAPKNIVIGGIERDTGAEKAWWLRKIDKVVIKGKIAFDRKAFNRQHKSKQSEELKKFLEREKKQQQKERASIFGAFFRIIDSFIDFVKTLFKLILGLFGF